MKITHYPSEEVLLDYVSGSLNEVWSLAVATHLSLCPQSRRTVSDMEAVAGKFLSEVEGTKVSTNLFEKIAVTIDNECCDDDEELEASEEKVDKFCLPEPLRSCAGGDVDDLKWRKFGSSAQQTLVLASKSGTVARLLKIPAGKPVPEHTHSGQEMTLVLDGAFEDHTGVYSRGDFQQANESLMHQPYAVPGNDCICLAVTDSPLHFKSLAARLLQPVIGI